MRTISRPCPCESGKSYELCCGQYIDSDLPVPSAEALMRSRYTAYVNSNAAYLLQTWHVSTRPESFSLEDSQPDKWLGLKVLQTQQGGMGDQQGHVEFIARYKVKGKAGRLHEISEFIHESGQWFYVHGTLIE